MGLLILEIQMKLDLVKSLKALKKTGQRERDVLVLGW
jgi:hypothetical protein